MHNIIFVQTDAGFNLAFLVFTELIDSDLLVPVTLNVVAIENIESNCNKCGSVDVYQVGGGRGNHNQCFARTASSVLRMCMLTSANVGWEHEPKFVPSSMDRNWTKINIHSTLSNCRPRFVLAHDRCSARKYYSSYDQN